MYTIAHPMSPYIWSNIGSKPIRLVKVTNIFKTFNTKRLSTFLTSSTDSKIRALMEKWDTFRERQLGENGLLPLWIGVFTNKCVHRELRSSSPNRGAVRRGDALLLTIYVISDVCDQKCDGQTNAWVVRWSWKTISAPWFGGDYWRGGRADSSNKTANTAKYSNCKGLNHETYDVSLQICDRGHFEFCLHFEFYFYHSPSIYKLRMIRFVHKVHSDVDF